MKRPTVLTTILVLVLHFVMGQATFTVQVTGKGEPVLIGHSLGGTLSLWLTSSESDMFKKAIVVDALTCTAALLNPNYRKGDFYEYNNPQSNNILNMSNEEFKINW